MSKVWVIADDPANIKVFKEKDDAEDYADIYNFTVIEAELVYVEPPTFPLPRSKYICTKCGMSRPKGFDNWFNVNPMDKAWCDICREDTEVKLEYPPT